MGNREDQSPAALDGWPYWKTRNAGKKPHSPCTLQLPSPSHAVPPSPWPTVALSYLTLQTHNEHFATPDADALPSYDRSHEALDLHSESCAFQNQGWAWGRCPRMIRGSSVHLSDAATRQMVLQAAVLPPGRWSFCSRTCGALSGASGIPICPGEPALCYDTTELLLFLRGNSLKYVNNKS